MMLKDFRAGCFEFRIIPESDITLPEYKGAIFRGGFGYAFRKIVCSIRSKQCCECLLKDKCVHSYFFETPVPKDTAMMRKYPHSPHPFIIEPPNEAKNFYLAGEEINFRLVLIGNAIEYLPYFIYTFEELGKMGLGKTRQNYNLTQVVAIDVSGKREKVYSGSDKTIKSKHNLITFKDIVRVTKELTGDTMTLRFLTPVRLKFSGKLTAHITFDIIVRNLLRRISSLSYFHCKEELNIDFKGLVEKAKEIKLEKSDIRWYDWERYSTRQNARMKLGGITGEATFSGNFKEFLPLLKLGELVHIGKGTTFGLGKYIIENRKA